MSAQELLWESLISGSLKVGAKWGSRIGVIPLWPMGRLRCKEEKVLLNQLLGSGLARGGGSGVDVAH